MKRSCTPNSIFAYRVIAIAALIHLPVMTQVFAGEIRENRFAVADASTESDESNKQANVVSKPTTLDIETVQKGLDLARKLIPEERLSQEQAFKNGDVKKIDQLTASLNQLKQCCVLLEKFGVSKFMPYLSFENQVFIAENGIASKLHPYLLRTASSAKEHADKIAAEEEIHRRRASTTWSAKSAPTIRQSPEEYDPQKLEQELKSIERQLRENQRRGESPQQSLLDRVDEIHQINKKKIDSMNRKSWQTGYSLDARRAAAMTILIRRGYTREEAALTVKSMEGLGLLPDPAKK